MSTIQKAQAEKSHSQSTAAYYTNEMLLKAIVVAEAAGAWILLYACRAEATSRGLAF